MIDANLELSNVFFVNVYEEITDNPMITYPIRTSLAIGLM